MGDADQPGQSTFFAESSTLEGVKNWGLWNMQGKQVVSLKDPQSLINRDDYQNTVTEMYTSFSPDGSRFITQNQNQILTMWNVQGQKLAQTQQAVNGIRSVLWSRDGQRIVSTSEDGTLRLWDVQFKLLSTQQAHQGMINWVVNSVDGQSFFTGGVDGKLRRWNVQGQLLETIETNTRVSIWAINPDNKWFATGEINPKTFAVRVRLWDFQSKLLDTFDLDRKFSGAAFRFTADGQQLLVGNKLLHRGTPLSTPIGIAQSNSILSMHFSPNGNLFTIKQANGTIQIHNAAGHQQGEISPIKNIKSAMVWPSPAGDRLLLSRDVGKSLELYNVQGKRLATLQGQPPSYCWGLANSSSSPESLACRSVSNPFSPDGKYFWTVGLAEPSKPVTSRSVDANREVPSSIQVDNTIRLWDRNGNLLTVIPIARPFNDLAMAERGLPEQVAAFSPQSDRFVIVNIRGQVNTRGQVQVRDLLSQQIVSQFTIEPGLLGISFSKDGSTLIGTYPPDARVKSSLFPESLSTATQAFVKVWNLDGKQLTQFDLELAVNPSIPIISDPTSPFEEEAERVITNFGSWLRQFEQHQVKLTSGEWLRMIMMADSIWRLPMDIPDVDEFADFQFNDAGDRFATLSYDGKIFVWDDQGNAIAQYAGNAMALSSDGKSIVIASAQDSLPRLWHVESVNELIQRGCNWLNLSETGRFVCAEFNLSD
ncbi:MAG: WD40 repeat domain-containing protein [Cyanobacteria bacterium CRU_2_1]|nr:WD40 repeat domain-containing protein [Cyanobacteria bacterium CRU_2_1]